MTRLRYCLPIVGLLAATTATLANPTLTGPVGQGLLMPSADTPGSGGVQLGASWYATDGSSEVRKLSVGAPCNGDGLSLRGAFGLGDRAEASVGFLTIDKSRGEADSIGFGLKYRVRQTDDSALALGASYRSWDSDLWMRLPGGVSFAPQGLPDVLSVYAVGTKELSVSDRGVLTGSLGLTYDHYDRAASVLAPIPWPPPPGIPIDPDLTIREEGFIRPFASLEFRGDCGWSIAGDFRFKEEEGRFKYSDTTASLTVRKAMEDGWGLEVGYHTFNVPWTDADGTIAAGLTWQR